MTNNIDKVLDSAFEAFNQGNLDVAEGFARDVIIMSPTHGDALYLLGMIAYRRGALDSAADLLHQAIQMYPGIENYQLVFAEVLRAQGHLNEALSWYAKVTMSPEVKTEMGLIYLMQGKRSLAEQAFSDALKEKSDIAPAYLGLAELACSVKQKEKLLLRAFEIQENENTAYHLSKFYVGKKDWEKAELILKSHLVYSRDWTLYGAILAALNRPQEALDALKKATDLDAYDSGAWTQRGLLLEHQKQWLEAELAYNQALALDSDDLTAHAGLSNVLVAVGKAPLALEHMRAIILKKPNDTPTLFKLAVLLQETENYEEALGLYFKLLAEGAKVGGLNGRIKSAILSLMQTKKRLAKRFIKGWIKNFPKNKVAAQMARYLKLILMAVWLCFSVAVYADNEAELILDWEAKQAAQGDSASQFFIAETFRLGRGVPVDTERAIFYYKKAAAQGHTEANMALGAMYETKNATESLPYYLAAAEDAYVPAMLKLGEIYTNRKEYQQAYNWYEKAMRIIFPNTRDLTTVSPDLEKLKKLIDEQKN
ncbi:MAG: tetratricopeptide repeat protein [Alphaproteobacteria bacterium]|nr:tetratricopeptide repeat protein [Alphaproteobacteria bacterium]